MRRRIQLLLVLLLWPTYAFFYQGAEHNEAARLDLVRAFVEDGVLHVDRFAYNSADLIRFKRGDVEHTYSGKAPGSSMLAAPPFALSSKLLRPFGLPEPLHWHAVVYATAIFTVNLLSALAAAALFGVCWRASGSAFAGLLGVLAVWLGSIVFPFSTLQFGHVLAAAFLVFAFVLVSPAIVPAYGGARSISAARATTAGFFAGFSVVIEYPCVLLVACLGVALATSSRRRALPLGCFVAGGLGAAALLAAYNLAAFGTLLYVPYEAYAQSESAFQAHQRGVLGIHWPGINAFLRVLAEITVRPQRGLLYLGVENLRVYATNPVLWLALPGLAFLFHDRETRPLATLVGAGVIALLVMNACFGDSIVYWGGGASVGPRHLIPALPLLAIPIARTVRPLRWVFIPLLLVSVFYMLLATATEPRVGYAFANPASDLFVASWLDGRFALNTGRLFDTGQPIHLLTEDSVAFNLGKLAGLGGPLQLAPLLLWWLVLGGALVQAARRADASAEGAKSSARSVRIAVWTLTAFGLFVVGWPLIVAGAG